MNECHHVFWVHHQREKIQQKLHLFGLKEAGTSFAFAGKTKLSQARFNPVCTGVIAKNYCDMLIRKMAFFDHTGNRLVLDKKFIINQELGGMGISYPTDFQFLGIDAFIALYDPVCQRENRCN